MSVAPFPIYSTGSAGAVFRNLSAHFRSKSTYSAQDGEADGKKDEERRRI
jgi:hypothetical protein